MGVLSHETRSPEGKAKRQVFGCLEETGNGLAFREIGAPRRRFVELSTSAMIELAKQGWDRRIDPEPHVMAKIMFSGPMKIVVAVEYVNPHHNID